jgi:hypothetical protein
MKMMAGCICLEAEKSALTSFSPSPTNLEVKVEALQKIVKFMSLYLNIYSKLK